MSISRQIKDKAVELGLTLAGITSAEAIGPEQAGRISVWLDEGRAGHMEYMHRNFNKRIDPGKLLAGAKSVVCIALGYKPRIDIKRPDSDSLLGRVANYAVYEDYHRFIKRRLYRLAEFMCSLANRKISFKICVDSAPVAERALAQRAGVGFIGRNHMLIHPLYGAEILLGEIISDMALDIDRPMSDRCPDCDRCIRACPTGALGTDGSLDAKKCISYLTIEHNGLIAPQQAGQIGDRIFGCEECVLACPYTIQSQQCQNRDFRFYAEKKWLDLKSILELDEPRFKNMFSDLPLLRCGLDRLKRNARICMKNVSCGGLSGGKEGICF
ncbi:MAG: tRNA epoxyqueuosine(34) reductase QueG [Planctomycetota bacterium]